jgi:hypothetical protein
MALRAATACVVEVGMQDNEVHAWYYDLRDHAPIPRHRVARVLRQVADQLDAAANELEQLEHT